MPSYPPVAMGLTPLDIGVGAVTIAISQLTGKPVDAFLIRQGRWGRLLSTAANSFRRLIDCGVLVENRQCVYVRGPTDLCQPSFTTGMSLRENLDGPSTGQEKALFEDHASSPLITSGEIASFEDLAAQIRFSTTDREYLLQTQQQVTVQAPIPRPTGQGISSAVRIVSIVTTTHEPPPAPRPSEPIRQLPCRPPAPLQPCCVELECVALQPAQQPVARLELFHTPARKSGENEINVHNNGTLMPLTPSQARAVLAAARAFRQDCKGYLGYKQCTDALGMKVTQFGTDLYSSLERKGYLERADKGIRCKKTEINIRTSGQETLHINVSGQLFEPPITVEAGVYSIEAILDQIEARLSANGSTGTNGNGGPPPMPDSVGADRAAASREAASPLPSAPPGVDSSEVVVVIANQHNPDHSAPTEPQVASVKEDLSPSNVVEYDADELLVALLGQQPDTSTLSFESALAATTAYHARAEKVLATLHIAATSLEPVEAALKERRQILEKAAQEARSPLPNPF